MVYISLHEVQVGSMTEPGWGMGGWGEGDGGWGGFLGGYSLLMD